MKIVMDVFYRDGSKDVLKPVLEYQEGCTTLDVVTQDLVSAKEGMLENWSRPAVSFGPPIVMYDDGMVELFNC